MNLIKMFLAASLAFVLVSCGQKDSADAPRSAASEQASKTSAASPLDSDFRLKDAAPIDVDALFALMPETSRPTYDSASFDEELGATVVTNLRFADANDDEGVVAERAEFYGVDLEAIDRIKAAQDAPLDAPFETVFEKVRLLNVASEGLEDADAELAIVIGGIEFDKLQIRQGGFDGDHDAEEGAQFFNAVTMAGVYFKDISVTAADDAAAAVSFSTPDLRFVGMGGGKLGAVIANDFEYEIAQTPESLAGLQETMGPQAGFLLSGPFAAFIAPENQRATMKSFEWRDLDFSGLLDYGLRGEEPPLTAENLIDLGTVSASDMETFINGKRAAVIEEATISAAEFTWLAPSKFRTDSKGVEYDFSAYVSDDDEAVMNIINEHGLDKVKGDGFAAWDWNADTGIAELEYAANMNGVADFAMTLGFDGFDLSDMAASQEDGESDVVLTHGEFKNFSLNITDEKALDAIFALSALQMGGSGDDLRLSAPAMIRLSGAQAAQMNPRISNYVNAIADFVAKGGALEISAEPAEPVAFTALQATSTAAPQTLPDVLELTVTHKE